MVSHHFPYPIGSMYAIYGNIYHQYSPNVSIYTIHGSYGYGILWPSIKLVKIYDKWGMASLALPRWCYPFRDGRVGVVSQG